MGEKALVLLSGGLDSAVTLYQAKTDLFNSEDSIEIIFFDYGQRHLNKEGKGSARLAGSLPRFRKELNLDFLTGNTSLLQNSDESPRIEETEDAIPSSWVPQRNMIFLTYAFAYADVIEADYIYTGFNAVDYSGYPDCRPEFVSRAEEALNFARKRYVEDNHLILIRTPIILKSKAEIVKLGLDLGVPFELTYSCYYGEEEACGE